MFLGHCIAIGKIAMFLQSPVSYEENSPLIILIIDETYKLINKRIICLINEDCATEKGSTNLINAILEKLKIFFVRIILNRERYFQRIM